MPLPGVLRHPAARVLLAIAAGATLGAVAPAAAAPCKVLADLFLNAVKLVTAPVIFLTVALGIAAMRDLGQLGRVGLKALVYFEVVSTVALAIGLVVVNVTRPGDGLDLSALAKADVSRFVQQGGALSWSEFVTHLVPASAVEAFARGDMLQVVVVALLAGIALVTAGGDAEPIVVAMERLAKVVYAAVAIVMRFAPLGAFGAMAYTVGTFGLRALLPLGRLMLDVYLTMALFVGVVLWGIARWSGFSLWALLRTIRDELLLVLATSSSEPALPRMLAKLEAFGCHRSIVGLVLPAGYSFNLDGTAIYLSMAVVFLAQVYGVDLSIGAQLGVLGVLMVTSKGAAGVTGSGFIVLASTLAAVKVVPVEGLAILLGVDRFMSEARAITNLCGNAVATVVVARAEGKFSAPQAPADGRSGGRAD
ncbi:MAG: C4-dicarboxylate transporter DctA [Gemmatimonadales bacterium]|nr:C4-dicarboxylate transporter DctA [Gemmatimonadales bacterium]